MENASKALIIAGAILLSILIIAIGIYIFNSAQGTIESSITSMNTQEIEAFNNQFTSYSNKQSGSNVKALLGRVIGNYNTYADEPSKVPTVTLNNITVKLPAGVTAGPATYNSVDENDGETYITLLSSFRNAIVNKHTYDITFDYGTSGLITNILIDDVTE